MRRPELVRSSTAARRRGAEKSITLKLIYEDDFLLPMDKQDINHIVKKFSIAMKKKGVPFYTIGILTGRNLIEIVVKRPEYHNDPKVLKKIPKTFEGLKVLAV